MPPTPAGNPSFPLSLFPNAVDELSNQPDPETAHAVMAIQSCLIGGSSGGAPSAPGLPGTNMSGPLKFTPDNTYDIGASGANRPRNGYFAGTLQGATIQSTANQFTNSVGANIYLSSGAPAAGLGNNGDFYFRSDTPGTANQRIYVKSAGAWVGIV